jgi:hypothetical protein
MILGRLPIARHAIASHNGAVYGVSSFSEFAPVKLFAGYSFDGTALTFLLSNLPTLSISEADETTGDLRKLFQALCILVHEKLESYPFAERPQTLSSFMLEDWNRKNATFGRHMKRSFTVQFITTSPPANVVEPE